MARVTVEDCLARVPNRFALTVLGSRRARAISEGRGRALVECENKEGVTALREISADRVRYKEVVSETVTEFIEEQRRQLRVTTGEHTFLEAASLRALEDDDDEDGVEEPDVEELQTDPEKLNKQAQGDSTQSDDDEDGDSDGDSESSSENADTPAADADDLDTEALGDDVDGEDDGEDGDAAKGS
ncbi:MAG: DNA-directed RNA polymerase subunit omega [Nannocystales bacterium]